MRQKPETVLLHSRADDVIPFADSEQLALRSKVTLIEVGNDHRLADPESLAVMLWACEVLRSGETLPQFDEEPVSQETQAASQMEASYTCDACGEKIVIPLDVTEGSRQTYVEDCPVCCRANTIHIDTDEDGAVHVRAELEQDPEQE